MSILNVDKIQPVGGGSTITVDATDIQASTGTIRASTFSGDISATGIGVTSLSVAGITTFSDNVNISSNKKLTLNNPGFEIYHDNSNAFLDNNVGHLYIRNDVDGDTNSNIYIQAKSGENGVSVGNDGSVVLYYDNNPKFQTTNTGTYTTGIGTFTDKISVIGSQNSMLTSNQLIFDRAGTSYIDNSNDSGALSFRIGSSYTVGLFIDSSANVSIPSKLMHHGDTNTFMEFGGDTITFDTGGNERLRITSGGHVNIGGSTQTSKTLYVDGTIEATSNFTCTNQIYLNGTAPQIVFTDTNQDSDYTIKNDFGSLQFIDRTNSNAIRMYANTGGFGGDRLYIADDIVHTGDTDTKIEFSTDTINFDTAGGERLRITSGGDIVLGHTAANARLHIASGTSNAVGNATNPAFQIGSAANYRFGIYTDGETAFFYNKNGDDGFHFLTKTTSGGNATKFKIHKDQVYGVDDYADTGTGERNSSQAHPTGVIEWQNNTDNGVNRYNIYIQATGGNETDMYITIRNGGFYRITIKASHNSTSSEIAQYLIYGLNSRATGNQIVEVVDTGGFTCTNHNTHVNTYDSTVKINYSGNANQGLRALVETIGGF